MSPARCWTPGAAPFYCACNFYHSSQDRVGLLGGIVRSVLRLIANAVGGPLCRGCGVTRGARPLSAATPGIGAARSKPAWAASFTIYDRAPTVSDQRRNVSLASSGISAMPLLTRTSVAIRPERHSRGPRVGALRRAAPRHATSSARLLLFVPFGAVRNCVTSGGYVLSRARRRIASAQQRCRTR